MGLNTPSGRAEFAGFAEFYNADIAPFLRAKEASRREAVMAFGAVLALTAGASFAIGRLSLLGDASIQFAIFAGMLGLALATWILNRTRNEIAGGLLERVCGRLGFSYRLALARPDYYTPFKDLGLLPAHNRESYEDEVAGTHADARFVFCEAHLRYKTSGKNSSTRTVFRGQLLAIDYPKRFFGKTVVKRDAGVLNRFMKPGKGFQPVGLVSSQFERAFEAWSTDQVEARELLDPVVLERFQELERLSGGKRLRAAFTDGKLIIAIETGDRLNMGTMFRPLENRARVETVLKEFDAIFNLIDVAVRRIEGRLDGAFKVGDVIA